MVAMRTLALLIVLACAACTKKPAAKAPAPATEQKPADAQPVERTAPTAAPPAPAPKPGDPCSGGEKKP